MITWRRGREIVTASGPKQEGPLDEFLEGLAGTTHRSSGCRAPRSSSTPQRHTPLALRAVEHLHAFQETVVMVSLDRIPIPQVDKEDRFAAEKIGKGIFKIMYLTIPQRLPRPEEPARRVRARP